MTTRQMIELEHQIINRMRAGQEQHAPLSTEMTSVRVGRDYPTLSEPQRTAVLQILSSRDQVVALEGVAGSGKTTTLAAVRDAAERAGHVVEGFAPTSRAAQQLASAAMRTDTLQGYLVRQEESRSHQLHLYVLDEASLASTRQMHEFLQRLEPADRILLVGDVRQHEAVEAGRPYHQLQAAGLQTARLDDIVRQRDPALRRVVEDLSQGRVAEAVQQLSDQGRVHEIPDREGRLTAIAARYVAYPEGTLVVAPDNESRVALNDTIHRALQTVNRVAGEDRQTTVLIPRQDLTGADRQWAERYEVGDLVRFSKGSQTLGLRAGSYARVEHVDRHANLLSVGATTGEQKTYDPRRLQGVNVYRPTDRALAVGDRVQFTAPLRDLQVANRELATIERWDAHSMLHLRLESGRHVALEPTRPLHLDYGYAVTSHSSQGLTADRVLVHVDTRRASEALVNRRLAYVAISRGRYDAHVYTDDAPRLAQLLARDSARSSALRIDQVTSASSTTRRHSNDQGIAL
jgi:ATP-dependent exoDNAse (exonuclease V) alpha subunit